MEKHTHRIKNHRIRASMRVSNMQILGQFNLRLEEGQFPNPRCFKEVFDKRYHPSSIPKTYIDKALFVLVKPQNAAAYTRRSIPLSGVLYMHIPAVTIHMLAQHFSFPRVTNRPAKVVDISDKDIEVRDQQMEIFCHGIEMKELKELVNEEGRSALNSIKEEYFTSVREEFTGYNNTYGIQHKTLLKVLNSGGVIIACTIELRVEDKKVVSDDIVKALELEDHKQYGLSPIKEAFLFLYDEPVSKDELAGIYSIRFTDPEKPYLEASFADVNHQTIQDAIKKDSKKTFSQTMEKYCTAEGVDEHERKRKTPPELDEALSQKLSKQRRLD